MMARAATLLLALWAGLAAARAEDIVLMMSTQDVAITSTYSGARVTVFGAIERDFSSISRPSRYDVVVSVAGPTAAVLVRHKEQAGPFWINRNLMRYADVPSYYALLTTGPINQIANEAARERNRMGLTYMLPAQLQLPDEINPERMARTALFRLRRQQQLLIEDVRAVQMPRPYLFSANVPLPAQAPTGRYVVTVTVLSEGVPLKTASTSFVVRKTGFEAYVAAYARDNGLMYGLATVGFAILFGLLGNVIFRKD